ncbi:glycosyltransferase [Trichothermofontia sichuanensis B231]|nr:glycosyltransferase [Trichothermofontia sichuanensis B231]
MSVFNAEHFVAKAIESILAQTFTNFEFLIADDGSQDHSFEIIKLYAAKDPRIKLFRQENQGLSKTLNFLLEQSQGIYIARMDADDISLPDRFQQQVNFLDQRPAVVCVGSAFEVIDDRDRYLTWLKLPIDDQAIQATALAGHGSICHPAAMIRRSALVKIGGYDTTLAQAEDIDLWLRLGEIGQLANLPQPLLRYRLHTQSVSGQCREQQRQSSRIACERAWQRRGIEGHFEASDPWRPGPDRASQHHFMLQYGWWAFNSRQRRTAIIYGLKAIQKLPWAIAGWKLLVVALIKPLPPVQQGPDPDASS